MEHTPVVSPALKAGYIPLQEFKSYMENGIPSPYPSKFSIAKLIKEMTARSSSLKAQSLHEAVGHLEVIESKIVKLDGSWESLIQQEEFDILMEHIFPSFFFQDQMGFIKGPFENHNFRFITEPMVQLLGDDRWEVKVDPRKFMNSNMQHVLMAGAMVLNTFYDQEVDIYSGEGMVLRDRHQKTEKHFKFKVQLDYLEVKAVKPLKKLNQSQIHDLLNNLEDEKLWLQHIPPENFMFEGFVVGIIEDVTKAEILSILKEMAANEGGKSSHENDLNYLEILVRSYLDMPDLQFGVLQTAAGPWIESLTWCLLRKYEKDIIPVSLEDIESPYGRTLHFKESIVVEDLKNKKKLSALEKALLKKGIRSLLLAPQTNDAGEVVGIFELASPEPYRFNQLTMHQLQEFIMLIEMGTNKFLQEMENSVRLTIQQEFTSIHPTVEWKFRQVASNYFWDRVIKEKQNTPEPIVFKKVYPLYGQADIVGSSRQRNKSIQADLIDNLERVYQVLVDCRQAVDFHLLDIYTENVANLIDKLRDQGVSSSDESVIVDFLTRKIHPLLQKLTERFPQLPKESLTAYFDYLDPDLNIVYKARKDYEDSVTLLNQAISHYLLEEEKKMQGILPHYFEKFQTDGVEYNLYVGQSLLENIEFHSFYLRDFRLWQLILMCEITRLVEKEAKTLPVPLTTAQLIFVFNSSLSIRFQMDEKLFDVDGAYNVRYEIIKKRIDKAYIKGTNERLTQAGKIAIVWLQEKDRLEYQEYLDHLVRKQYISPDIEDLELDRMQGVEGLKAIRVTVI